MHAACITRFRLALLVLPLLALPATAAPVALPGGVTIRRVDFERHVMGVFGRMGCNAGSCHGSFQGKGGFRLSLFGYDPARDYLALTREVSGRRLDRADPDNSLLLLKATGQLPHGGKTRFTRDTWAYQLLRTWIADGARWQQGSGEVTGLTITPAEQVFARTGQNAQLRVVAAFADGSKEDVTPLCEFRTTDDAVAVLTGVGGVRSVKPGDTAVIVSYRGHVTPVRVLVAAPSPPGFRYPRVPEVNYIDREVFAKLRRLNMVPSDLCDDRTFLRRVTLDTIGTLPTPEEVRAFVADRRSDKRVRKIDQLLAHPMHAALWATKFCDITGNNTDALENPQQRKAELSQRWHDWFRKRVAENMPYDEIVRGVLCATSREGASPEDYIKQVLAVEGIDRKFNTVYAKRATLDLFWRRQQNVAINIWGEKTAAAFLGVRLECAQCHKHPFDRWTQADYRAYANIFGPVTFGISPEAAKPFRVENGKRNPRGKAKKGVVPRAGLREVFLANNGRGGRGGRLLPHPDTNRPLPPKALGGPEITAEAGKDPRADLFEWMRSPDNPFFARSFANRIWGHYFGIGIVHPVDDFSLANPPSNPKLLNALAKDFVEGKYDIRRLERRILLSRTYQLASAVNASNRFDRINYAHAYVRPLMAEVVVDMLNTALGVTEKDFGPGTLSGCRAIEVGASRVQNGTVAYAFRVFGRPPRSTACDCERAMEPGLTQKLFLMVDPALQTKLRTSQNRLNQILAEQKDDEAVLEELFLATLSRSPTDTEKKAYARHRARCKDRRAALTDTLWALVNTSEFLFNH